MNTIYIRILAATDADRQAQAARSKKYGIAVRGDGHVTKPSEWASVPDSQFLDPVNYAYPCPNADQTRAAASYWGKAADKAKYSEADRKKLDARLAHFEKKFAIGQGNTTGAAQLSFGDIRDLLYHALPDNFYILDVFGDRLIAENSDTDEMWMIPYTIMDGKVTLGDRLAVEQQYVKVQAAARILSASGKPADSDYGYKWGVQIVEAGPDLQGIATYPYEVLKAGASAYEGAKVFALSQGQHAHPSNPYGKSVRDLVGWISGVVPNAIGLEGNFNILKSAGWLRDMAVDAWARGKKDLIGLSHDVLAETAPGQPPRTVRKIVRVDSVDVVYDPIAGGKFLRMAAAARTAGLKEGTMWKQLLAALKTQRPDLKEQIEALEAKGDAATEDEITKLVAAAAVKPDGNGQKKEIDELVDKLSRLLGTGHLENIRAASEKVMRDLEEYRKLGICAGLLIEELANCGLPDIMKSRIRRQFEGKVYEETALKAAIREEKEIADKLTGSGAPTGVGGLRAEVGEGEPEKLQAALDKLFSVEVEEKFKPVPAFTSLRGAYTRLTGDPELRGIPSREGMKLGEAFMSMMRLPAAYSTSTFSFVLGVSMYKRLLKEYAVVKYHEEVLISFLRNAQDFKTMEIIQVGYFGDVPDVNPETADYVEITMPTDIEATYSLNQKGWILSVTRRAMLGDDLKTITQLLSKMGRAHGRTHAKRAWNKIINNATFKGDSTALFDASHGNLGAVGLTADATGITTLTNRLKAMYAQTERDSGEAMGLVPLYLWCPRDKREVAETLNSPWPGATAPNPHAGRFGQNHERIITNPLFADADDWGLIANAADVELLEAAYMNGRREPEFFLADNPVVGQMFIADKIQYKSRHEFEFEIADYPGFDKSVVT